MNGERLLVVGDDATITTALWRHQPSGPDVTSSGGPRWSTVHGRRLRCPIVADEAGPGW